MQKDIASLVGKKLEIESRVSTVDTKNYTVDFVLSTSDIDRHGDIIDQESWILTHFENNPVLLEQHRSSEFPLGKFTKIWTEVDANGKTQLVGTAKFAVEEYDQARIAFALVSNGFMSTVSVGFIPHVVDYDEVRDAFTLKECELLEVSLVSVPANRMALVKAHGLETLDHEKTAENIKQEVIESKKDLETIIEVAPTDPATNRRKNALALLNKAIRQITK